MTHDLWFKSTFKCDHAFPNNMAESFVQTSTSAWAKRYKQNWESARVILTRLLPPNKKQKKNPKIILTDQNYNVNITSRRMLKKCMFSSPLKFHRAQLNVCMQYAKNGHLNTKFTNRASKNGHSIPSVHF